MNIEFEEIKDEDLGEVKEIYDWYVAHTTATFHTEPVEIAQLKEFIHVGHPKYKSYLIRVDKEITGYCYVSSHKSRQAYDRTGEITIYLKPDSRKKGIGKVALNYLETIAKGKGLKNLIGVITGDNAESIALFERSGYVKCAHFRNVGEKFNRVLDVVAYQKEI
jgi:phosphinothricin acetyltransferase